MKIIPLFLLFMTLPLHAEVSAPEANNLFALDCLAHLQKSPGNIAFSPFSAWLVLAMTSGGAKGSTLSEMAGALHFSEASQDIHSATAVWNSKLQSLRKIRLLSANRLWLAEDFPITAAFLNLTEETYHAGMERLPFAKNPEGSLKSINRWISKQTNGRIPELLQNQDVRVDTKLVLTNAIYFNADRLRPFDASETRDFPFTRSDGKVEQTPMMLRKSSIPYFENKQLQAVRLAYAGEETSMIIVLPAKGEKLTLDHSLFKAVSREMTDQKVILRLPRFTINERIEMLDLLRKLGMKKAFTNEADFSGISAQEKLSIGAVVHQAFVKVGEKGTEAAAATAVTMRATSAMIEEPSKEFIANRPFYFFILHDASGGILFGGRVEKPDAPEVR